AASAPPQSTARTGRRTRTLLLTIPSRARHPQAFLGCTKRVGRERSAFAVHLEAETLCKHQLQHQPDSIFRDGALRLCFDVESLGIHPPGCPEELDVLKMVGI